MKKTILTMALLVSMLGAYAQSENDRPERPDGPRNETPEQRIEHHMKMMNKDLNLTDEQQTKIKAIMTEQFSKEASASSSSKEDRRAQMEEMETKIKSVLTDEQKTKYEEMRKRGPKGGPKGGPRGEKKSND